MMHLVLSPPPPRPPRRCLWAAELRRALAFLADARARDRQREADTIAALQGQIADLRWRLADLERVTGAADLRRPERVRRFAR